MVVQHTHATMDIWVILCLIMFIGLSIIYIYRHVKRNKMIKEMEEELQQMKEDASLDS